MTSRFRLAVGLVLLLVEVVGFSDRTPPVAPGVSLESLSAPHALFPRLLEVLARALAGFAVFVAGNMLIRNGQSLAVAAPFPWLRLAPHIAAVAAFLAVSPGGRVDPSASPALAWAWMLLAVAAVAALGWTFVSRDVIAALTPALLAGGLGAAALAAASFRIARVWWETPDASRITFDATLAVLRWIDPSAWGAGQRLGLANFGVRVGFECAGYSGVVLFVTFAAMWLASFRIEYRFPVALILLPVGALLSWSLNVVRIVVLVLIGNAGYQEVAVDGFHTHAGWIFFTVLASGFCLISARLPGIGASIPKPAARNPAAIYLAPFVALHAGAMISGAASGGFEWLYPIRGLAVATVLVWWWKEYRGFSPRHGLIAYACGMGVFAVWALLAAGLPSDPGPSAQLAQLGEPWRSGWIFFRVAGAVLLVPFAEELAFRGFLQRRVSSAGFEHLDPRRASWLGVVVASIVFGLLHGQRWAAGIGAGLAYGLLYSRTGRIGDPIVAHVVTNLLLMGLVLGTGDWRYW